MIEIVTRKEISLKIKKQLLREANPYTNQINIKRALGIVSDEMGYYSDKELDELKAQLKGD